MYKIEFPCRCVALVGENGEILDWNDGISDGNVCVKPIWNEKG